MRCSERGKGRFGLIGTITWDKIHRASGERWQTPGGILYQAACLCALGAEVILMSQVGAELWTKIQKIIAGWPGLKLDGLKIIPGPGNVVQLDYPARGERREKLNWAAPPLSLSQIWPLLDKIDFLMMVFNSGFDLDFYAWRQIIQKRSFPLWLDLHSLVLSPRFGRRKYESLVSWPAWVEGVDYLQVNEREAACLLGFPERKLTLDDLNFLADQALALGLKALFITLGKKGVFVATPDNREIIRVKERKRIVDSTGCGDCLAACCGWQLFQGKSVAEAIRFGVSAAGHLVSTRGVTSAFRLISKFSQKKEVVTKK